MTKSVAVTLEKIANYLETGSKSQPSGKLEDPALTMEDILTYLDAATGHAGVVELATSTEALTGTDAVRAMTAAGVRAVMGGLKFISFDGKNGTGACTAAGAVVGDIVLGVFGLTAGALGDASSSFESAITVVDEIQQSAAGDLSANDYVAVLLAVA